MRGLRQAHLSPPPTWACWAPQGTPQEGLCPRLEQPCGGRDTQTPRTASGVRLPQVLSRRTRSRLLWTLRCDPEALSFVSPPRGSRAVLLELLELLVRAGLLLPRGRQAAPPGSARSLTSRGTVLRASGPGVGDRAGTRTDKPEPWDPRRAQGHGQSRPRRPPVTAHTPADGASKHIFRTITSKQCPRPWGRCPHRARVARAPDEGGSGTGRACSHSRLGSPDRPPSHGLVPTLPHPCTPHPAWRDLGPCRRTPALAGRDRATPQPSSPPGVRLETVTFFEDCDVFETNTENLSFCNLCV